MGRSPDEPVSLAELDARHDELLCQLEELDQRIQSVLKEYLPQKATASLRPAGDDIPLPVPIEAKFPSLGMPAVTYAGPSAPTC